LGSALRPAPARPSRPRSFDPIRVADLEFRAWVGYYRREWLQVLVSSIRLVKMGFGMDWIRTLFGAWLVLRANQQWATPKCDEAGARRHMREFYALVRLTYGKPEDPARAADLEVEWWRQHRENSRDGGPRAEDDDLVQSVTQLYSYLYGEPEELVHPAAAQRVLAMDLCDQWVAEGRRPDSQLLGLQHAALVRSYAALLAAVHH
jgi:hypothetical protein